MPRKTQRDWLEAGLILLCQSGDSALTIEELTRRLGVTKGSFYHHFRNAEDYKEKLLAFWEAEGTLNIIDIAKEAGSPVQIMDRIVHAVANQPYDAEPALRNWAARDPQVRQMLERVDQERLRYGQELFEAITGDAEQALIMVRMLYSILLGGGDFIPPLSRDEHMQLYEEFKWLYHLE